MSIFQDAATYSRTQTTPKLGNHSARRVDGFCRLRHGQDVRTDPPTVFQLLTRLGPRIQRTIREQFNRSILLTIAHRLHTVIDYDRILVLDQGQVVEFDSPAALITKEDGIFYGMCKQSGHFDELCVAAERKTAVLVAHTEIGGVDDFE